MREYTGRIVYLGIDVHKKSYSVTAVCDGAVVKTARLKACPSEFLQFCPKFFPGAEIRTCYEAGFSGFSFHRKLLKEGVNNIVIHPASVEVEVNNRVKNDKRDSKKLAVQLAQGRLKGIHVPAQEREDFRTVSRLRDTLMKERVRTGQRIKSLLYCQGALGYLDTPRVSANWLKEVLKMEFSSEVKYTLNTYIKTWFQLTESIKETCTKLQAQALQDKELEEIYTSLVGIGPTAARILINELGDLSQFSNERCLFSFVGLTPSEHSSGEHRRLGHISRQGRPNLRKILVQCAWVAIKHDHSLKNDFEKLESRVGARKAIVAIARKLIGRAFSCVKARRKYRTITESGELVIQTSVDTPEVIQACEEAVRSCS